VKPYVALPIALLLLMATWVTACNGGPSSIMLPGEPTAAPTESAGMPKGTTAPTLESETEEEEMTPTPTPEATEVELPPQDEQVVKMARADLAERLDLTSASIRLVSVEPVDWPDTSLGCPQPGMMYAQVITPGFRVVLEAEGRTYEYHTDIDDRVILCQAEGCGQ
jgi:hypothetical protein